MELSRLCAEYGQDVVIAYMGHIRNNSADSVRLALRRFLEGKPRREFEFADTMDGGAPIRVAIALEDGGAPPDTCRAVMDFTGSAPRHEGSLNAPEAVVRSAALYVLRLLAERDIPLNSGCTVPVKIVIPPGILSPPADAAVAGGNVETSQRVVDVLLGALGLAGASQGTMNNLALGWSVEDGASFDGRYYETIAGGAGATHGRDGASGVQTHMTNTRITDPEVFELRYPGVRILRFAIRRGSGGAGKWRGGDGLVRAFEILQPCRMTLLSERRAVRPYGALGGGPGLQGENILMREGRTTDLGGSADMELLPGDELTILTPGGGGFLPPD